MRGHVGGLEETTCPDLHVQKRNSFMSDGEEYEGICKCGGSHLQISAFLVTKKFYVGFELQGETIKRGFMGFHSMGTSIARTQTQGWVSLDGRILMLIGIARAWTMS